jgi:large subunit ribosomal protein L24
MAAIKKGDTVKVLTGKAKNETGVVLKAIKASDKIVVEGVNIVKKHQKPSQTNQQGGIVEEEAAIHVSNVTLVKEGN